MEQRREKREVVGQEVNEEQRREKREVDRAGSERGAEERKARGG